jgi:hypothetical protein
MGAKGLGIDTTANIVAHIFHPAGLANAVRGMVGNSGEAQKGLHNPKKNDRCEKKSMEEHDRKLERLAVKCNVSGF